MPTRPKLTSEDRRQIVVAVLFGDESYRTVADRYGVNHSLVHRLVKQAREADPQERIAEAEAEAAFWRKIEEEV